MDAATQNANSPKSVRKSKRIKKPKKLYDPSDIKGSHRRSELSTSTTTQLATSSSIVKVYSLAGGAMCEQPVSSHANINGDGRNGTGTNGAGGNGADATSNNNNSNSNKILASSSSRTVFDYTSIEKWSAQEVGNFFEKYHPRASSTFIEQDIDGLALFLIRRCDVMSRLKLGKRSAPQVYNLVKILRTKDENKINEFLASKNMA